MSVIKKQNSLAHRILTAPNQRNLADNKSGKDIIKALNRTYEAGSGQQDHQ